MKKIVLTLFSTIVLLNFMYAQASAYTFAQSSGTYTPITGATLLASGITPDDNVYGPLNIGFTFNFNGTNYTQFGLNVNGWISLGSAVPTSSYTPISGGTINNIICPMGKDLQLGYTSSGVATVGSAIVTNVSSTTGFVVGDTLKTATGFTGTPTITALTTTTLTLSSNATTATTAGTYTVGGTIRYQTTGTAPNRVCVIQWNRARRYNTTATTGMNNLFNFQIRLTETTNTIAFVYGTFQTNATASVYQVGLRGASLTDFNNRKTLTDWSATTAGTANTDTCRLSTTVKPASGQTYTWSPPPACTGTPTAGTASAPTGACSGVAFNLTLTGFTTNVSGLTFQWQSSTTSGGTYTNITGGTTAVFSTTQTAAMFYKCVVTCTGSGQTATSNVVNVTMNTPAGCYCIAVHSGACSTTDNIDSVRIVGTTLANLHTGCTGTNGNAYTIYPSTGNTTASLQAGSTYTFKVTTTTNNIISIWMDYNQNGTFEASEWTQVCTTSVANTVNSIAIAIPSSALAGLTGLRIRSRLNGNTNGATDACTTFGSGETEDYKVTVIAATPCTGAPTAGTASAPASVCSGASFSLTLTGYSANSGLTFQWQSSTASGGTYTNISGATSTTYSTTQTTALFYKCVVTCTASSQTATSNVVNVTMNTPAGCFCTSAATSASDEDIFNVTVGTLNNSSTCSTTGGTGSTLNLYSNYSSVTAPNLAKGASTAFSVQIGTCGTGSFKTAFKIFIDYNQNGSFAEVGERAFQSDTAMGTYTKTGTFMVPTSAVLGNTRMRVVLTETTSASSIDSCGTYPYGETEDYTVNITAATGIDENTLNNFSVYPNPTTGMFTISANNVHFTTLAINVFDIQGKEVFNAIDKNNSLDYNKQINLEGLSKGIYYIKLNAGNGTKIQKLVIR